MNPAEAINKIQESAESFVASTRAALSASEDAVLKTKFEEHLANFREQMRAQAPEWIRGPHLFRDPEKQTECPWKDHIQPFRGEYLVAIWKSDGYRSPVITCTNVGRIVSTAKYSAPEQIRGPGMKLTREVIRYIAEIKNQKVACTIINAYNETYAFAHNSVHEAKIEAIRKEIKQGLADEFAKLAEERSHLEAAVKLHEEQANVLKTQQEEFAQKTASERERRRTERELDDSRRQAAAIKGLLSREIANVDKHMESSTHEEWPRLRKKLINCEALLHEESAESD
jgi:hypothetical protein